jgi:hypothetical protein
MLKIIVMCHGNFELVSDAFRFNFEIKSNFERVLVKKLWISLNHML